MKSGVIEDGDCDTLFKDLAVHISDKYSGVGIDLGVSSTKIKNEVDTVLLTLGPVSEKAKKMLEVWQKDVAKANRTYSALAAALEKNGLTCYADKYCYTTA